MNKPIVQLISISDDEIKTDLRMYLEQQANTYNLQYFLGHAEDGVIWGKINQGILKTADAVFNNLPKLRLETLLQCRLFGEKGEILIWKKDGDWKSRLIEDNSKTDMIPECQILWGTKGEEKEEFTLLSDGSQGLKHAVPLTGIKFNKQSEKMSLYRPVRLKVHHYIDYNDDGVARIFLSRLVSLYSIDP